MSHLNVIHLSINDTNPTVGPSSVAFSDLDDLHHRGFRRHERLHHGGDLVR